MIGYWASSHTDGGQAIKNLITLPTDHNQAPQKFIHRLPPSGLEPTIQKPCDQSTEPTGWPCH